MARFTGTLAMESAARRISWLTSLMPCDGDTTGLTASTLTPAAATPAARYVRAVDAARCLPPFVKTLSCMIYAFPQVGCTDPQQPIQKIIIGVERRSAPADESLI